MIKKLAIKIFNLNDISNILLTAKKKQKDTDDKYWKEILDEEISSLKREHQLELQEKDSTISMLTEHIDAFKKKDKSVADREFKSKRQIKENYFVAKNIADKMKDFTTSVNNIYGEMLGIEDSVKKHQKTLENMK